DISLMLFCSYLIGMELPGRRALFHRFSMTEIGAVKQFPFEYDASVDSYDDRFDLLKISARISNGTDRIAQIHLDAFVRPDSPTPGAPRLVGPHPGFEGKVAVVIGASRGLGAAIAEGLALSGATVLANYHHSAAEVEGIKSRLQAAKGRLIPIGG